MTALPIADGRTSRRWVELRSLGPATAPVDLLRRWAEGLRAVPGASLLVEQGAHGGRAFLRVEGPSEVVLLPPPDARPTTVSARGIAPVGAPPPTGSAPRCFGRLVASVAAPSLPPRWQPSAEVPGASGTGGPVGALPLDTDWGVQGFLRSWRGALQAHLRLAVGGPADVRAARASLDRLGVAWGSHFGMRYDPWVPGSSAHRCAELEWDTRKVDRFHSGIGLAVDLDRWCRAWSAPPGGTALSAETEEGPGGLALGQRWGSGGRIALSPPSLLRHVGIVGMTGSGKSQLLAHLTAGAIRQGVPSVVFDLHGDLAGAVGSRLPPELASRLAVLDATWPPERLRGIDVLTKVDPRDPDAERRIDQVSSELLSALRPVGGGSEEFWGPRMERILDCALRVVLESGGDLYDVAELLHDPVRRGGALRERIRSEALVEFLDALPAQLRRQPDLLVSSQNRLAKVYLSRSVQRLVAPGPGGWDVEALVEEGRTLLLHLPKGELGESSSLFVANLLLARLFHLLLRGRPEPGREVPRVLFVLDEAQGFAPRLLRGIIEEGRKFGVACVFATQSPGRLEQLLGRFPGDGVGTLIALKVPPEDALRLAPALTGGGAPVRDGHPLAAVLATLPPHAGWVRSSGTGATELVRFPDPVASRWVPPPPPPTDLAPEVAAAPPLEGEEGRAARDLLLRVVREEARPSLLGLATPPAASASVPRATDPEALCAAAGRAVREGWIEKTSPEGDGSPRYRMRRAGWNVLGWREVSGALQESSEHRRLVRRAFELFARRGVLLEIPTQGSFGRTPDALARLWPNPGVLRTLRAPEVSRLVAELGRSWLYRLGGGRDVHVEAEVSGCARVERLDSSRKKAREADAFLLFVVRDTRDGDRVRRYLRREGVPASDATVWVLREARPTPEGSPGPSP